MTREEIANEFVRVELGTDGITFSVGLISWPHPHEPVLSWTKAATLARISTPDQIENQINRLLGDDRHFLTCDEC
jgi:hypothetical protein